MMPRARQTPVAAPPGAETPASPPPRIGVSRVRTTKGGSVSRDSFSVWYVSSARQAADGKPSHASPCSVAALRAVERHFAQEPFPDRPGFSKFA